MEKKAYLQRSNAGTFNYKSPLLFSIPQDVYSDEFEKDRDKDLFLRVKNLSEKFEELKERFLFYTERHALRIEATRNMILHTLEVGNRIRCRKDKYNRYVA